MPVGSSHDGEVHITDEHNIYVIAQNGEQIRITDIFWISNEAALAGITTPLLKKIYLAYAEGTLWRHSGTAWVRLSDYRSRSTHTGTQTVSTISDFALGVRGVRMQALERDADFTADGSYNMSIVRCYDGCSEITLGTSIDGAYFELFNNAGTTITLVDVTVGPSSFDDNELVAVRGVKNVGWVAKIIG